MAQPRTHKRYDRDFKFSVVRPIATGEKSPTETCREHGLANSVLDRWRKEYDRLGEEAFQSRQRWYSSRPVVAEKEEEILEKIPTMIAGSEGTGADRIALLERLCGSLAVENFFLKQVLRAAGQQNAQLSVPA